MTEKDLEQIEACYGLNAPTYQDPQNRDMRRLIAEVRKQREPAAWMLYKFGEFYGLRTEREDRGEAYTWEPLFRGAKPTLADRQT